MKISALWQAWKKLVLCPENVDQKSAPRELKPSNWLPERENVARDIAAVGHTFADEFQEWLTQTACATLNLTSHTSNKQQMDPFFLLQLDVIQVPSDAPR